VFWRHIRLMKEGKPASVNNKLMTKDQFIENLKENKRQTNSFNDVGCFLIVFLFIFTGFISIRFDISWWWLVVVIFLGIDFFEDRKIKKVDNDTYMFCLNCKKHFDKDTLDQAILMNECQNCGSQIYQTEIKINDTPE